MSCLFIFSDGYGKVPFIPTEIYNSELGVQFRGKIKLPKGHRTGDGKKWIEKDYWYTCDEIHNAI